VAYIGTAPTAGQYRKLDSISSSFNGSTTTFTMQVGGQNVSAGTPAQLLISLGGVIQQPTTDYTVSTSSLTFVTAPASGLSFFAILMGDALSVGTPADGTVSTAKLADAAVTTAKLADAGVTTAKLASGLTVDLTSGSAAAPSLTFDADTGLYSPAEDTIGFVEGGVEAARIDSSGRLLVGTTTTAGAKLHVVGGATAGAVDNAAIFVGGSGTVGSGARIYLSGVPGFETTRGAYIEGVHDTATNAHSLRFATNASTSDPVERMRIANDGEVMIGHSSAVTGPQFLSIRPTSASAGASFEGDSTSGRTMITFRNPNGEVGYISSSGSSTGYNTSSDYRLKENVTTVTDGITRLQQLKPSRFNFIADPDKTVDGFIAHEVQTVVPEAIHGEKDAVDGNGNPVYQGIDQSKLVPLLTAALQEAIGEIESLKARVAALESA